MLKFPNELEWQEGPLPDVHSVSKNCRILIWITDVKTGECCGLREVYPSENELNPLRWYLDGLPFCGDLDHYGVGKFKIGLWAKLRG